MDQIGVLKFKYLRYMLYKTLVVMNIISLYEKLDCKNGSGKY